MKTEMIGADQGLERVVQNENERCVTSPSEMSDNEGNGSSVSRMLTAMMKDSSGGPINCGPCRLRERCRKAASGISATLPQHAPLYAALFCSIIAVTFSIRTHLSTHFVQLEEPLRISPFIRNMDYIGLSTWELCVIKQDVLEELHDSAPENTGQKKSLFRPSMNDIMFGDTIDDDEADTTAVISKLTISTMTTTYDVQRNITSHVRTTYHPHSLKQSPTWMEEPDHDDVLVSGDYPYNDDDDFESSLPNDYWNCHHIQLTSKSVDSKWVVARVFFMMGTLAGVVATMLLITLIVIRGRDAKQRVHPRRREIKQDLLLQRQQQHNGRFNSSVSDLLLLDTDSSGYRPISICFLLSYLLQSLTLLFLDSQLCREQACSMATGAHGLLAACVLWVVCGLLILFMMKRVRRNERRVRRFKRRMARMASSEREESPVQNDDNIDGAERALLPAIPECDEDSSIGSDDKEDDGPLDTTLDTESSGSSSVVLSQGN